ncbi:MAG: hypothetical protein M9894_15075 [Planctomycetes bacterium]|nr:hypothetical protein [Planctomycetota bacterium]
MRKLAAALVTVLFLALLAYQVHHDLVRQEPWAGHTALSTRLVFVLGPLWLAGAVCVWLRSDLAWFGILPGVLATLVHGVAVAIGGATLLGALYLVCVPALLLLARYARAADPIGALTAPERPARVPEGAARRERPLVGKR